MRSRSCGLENLKSCAMALTRSVMVSMFGAPASLLPSAQSKYQITMRQQPGITFNRKMTATFGAKTLQFLDVTDLGETLRPAVVIIAADVTG